MASRPRPELTARMAEVRKKRNRAFFTEITLWVPDEHVEEVRNIAWDFIDHCGREFPHRAARRAPKSKRLRK